MITEYVDPKRIEARNAPHAKYMTESQMDVTWDMVSIVRRGMLRSGKFSETLGQLAGTYALDQNIPKDQAEFILRDQYEARYGEGMKQTLDNLRERETVLREAGTEQALHHAQRVEGHIKNGQTMPAYKAIDVEGVEMSQKHGITEIAAKSMMNDAFEKENGRSLYEVGKELEAQYHKPVRDAERAALRAQRQRTGPQM